MELVEVKLPKNMIDYMALRAEADGFQDISEYIRHLVRLDKDANSLSRSFSHTIKYPTPPAPFTEKVLYE